MAGWRVAVVGPGGVGGLLGAVLSRAGRPVVYVARPDTVEALNRNGLSVRSQVYGDFAVPAVAVPALSEPVDLYLVTVKATSLAAALDAVPAAGDGLVLPLLNGVEHMALLREHFGPDRVVAGAIRVETTRVAPGVIEHTSPFCWIDVASSTVPRSRVEALATELTDAGIDVNVRDDEPTLLWDKLVLLAPLALLTTAAAAPAGVVRDERGAELEAVTREVAAVAEAAGASVDVSSVLALLAAVPAAMKSSMQRDVEAGRPTELDAIGGAVLRAGQRYGVPTPVTAQLVEELRSR
jgi:2-dehydropantoate 2-reductase